MAAQIHGVTRDERLVADAIKTAIVTARPRVSITKLAPRIGLTYDRLSNIANGRTAADAEVVDKLRRELKKPSTWPFDEVEGRPRPGQHVSLAGTPLVEIPVVGSIAAGSGAHNVDPDRQKVAVPSRLAELGALAWIVEGDSMMPFLHEDDIAVFAKRSRARHGYAFLVRMPDGQDRVKMTIWNGNRFELRSLNSAYPPESMENVQILGILVGFYRVRGTRELMDSDPDGLSPDLYIA